MDRIQEREAEQTHFILFYFAGKVKKIVCQIIVINHLVENVSLFENAKLITHISFTYKVQLNPFYFSVDCIWQNNVDLEVLGLYKSEIRSHQNQSERGTPFFFHLQLGDET